MACQSGCAPRWRHGHDSPAGQAHRSAAGLLTAWWSQAWRSTGPPWPASRRWDIVSLFQSGLYDFEQDPVRRFEHGRVVEVVFAFGVFGSIAGRPEKHLNAPASQVGDRGIDIRLALGDYRQVV